MNWLTLQNNLIHVSESNLCRNADNECKNVQFASAIDITEPTCLFAWHLNTETT